MKYLLLIVAWVLAAMEGMFAVPLCLLFAFICMLWDDGAFVPGKPE